MAARSTASDPTAPPRPIETNYEGYRFRSRLEARWAVYFDAIGIKWEYEFEGFNLGGGLFYLPDFWLPQVSMWAEVKPGRFDADAIQKATRLLKVTGCSVIMLDGTPRGRPYGVIEFVGEELVVGEPGGIDVALSAYHGYLRNEGRFYANSGLSLESEWGEPFYRYFPDTKRAVSAARRARFEHGEGD